MSSNSIIDEIVQKSLDEIENGQKPKRLIQTTRSWSSTNGYRYLVQWSNLVLLRYFVRMFTKSLPKSEYRRVSQLDDCARSTVRNIEEGYKRATTKDYLDFIGYTQGSLEEVKGDIRESTEDGFLASRPGSSLKDLGIDLGALNSALKPDPTGKYRNLKENTGKKQPPESDQIFSYTPITDLYPPLKGITVSSLTTEIFLELINKSDFLLRKLVISLEKKPRK